MGVFRGHKQGMSQELLPLLEWLAIALTGSVAYQLIGDGLAQTSSVFSPWGSHVIGYLLAAGGVAIVLVFVKRRFHGKRMGSDAFGSNEYYLGMPAGMVRFFCMLLTGLALLNARLYTPQEIAAWKKYQMENFDSEYFQGLQALQAHVSEKSFTGSLIKEHLGFLLIKPTA